MSRIAARVPAAAPATAAPSRLRMTRPGDRFEAGADRLAEPGGATPRARAEDAAGWAPAGLEAQIAAARSERTGLPAGSRSFFEGRFGRDFGAVGIHAGTAAAAAAASAAARAFTVGRDIFFGAGQYRPGDHDLVGHELAHTVQDRPDVVARRALDGGAALPMDQPMPSFTAAGAPPSAVKAVPAQPAPDVAPSHAQKSADAASHMQRAIAAVAAEPATEAAAVGGDVGGADAGAAPRAQGGGAAQAAQDAAARLGAQLAELGAVQGRPIQFQQDADGPAGDPVAFARNMQSQSLASGFVRRAAGRIAGVLNAAMAIPGQALAALGVAREAVATQAAAQGAALKAGADASRKRVHAQTSRIRGAIAGRHAAADKTAAAEVQAARDRAQRAHDQAATSLGRRAETEKTRIRRSYVNAQPPMEAVGVTAGSLARAAANRQSDSWLAQRDGESSILDGPLHDNRLEAKAEAAVKVGDEYAKSFEASAVEQAGQIPASQPDVLAKVDGITGEARTGLAAQLTQILQGATALGKGSSAQSRGAAAQMRAALDGASMQSTQALETAEAQQTAALTAQATAAQGALDGAVGAGLSGFADGMVEASSGLVGSLHSFIDAAAAMPAPERDDLEPALSGADPEGPLAGMAAQLKTFTPGLTGILQDGREASEAALLAASGLARQGFDQSTTGFVTTATGINQQSATGFHKLGAGTKRSAAEVGSTAEAGFKDAETNASAAYGQFGDQVEANFKTGRDQMLGGLWGKENQGKLHDQIQKSGDEAASHVQPRWKKVLKWVVTIVVIVAVIAITIASAGALGPVGVILLGAALGAAAGAVQTIANNLIDGEPWSKGVVKAMIVGAIGGAVGGAGGVLLKGVGSVALKITLEFGVNVVGGVAAEAVGAGATGEAFNFTSALMGAMIGAGVGAGLGIAGALKGKIRIGSVGEPVVPRPTIEPPAPPPAGKVRSALEAAQILKPRPGAVVPEVNVGVGAGGAAEQPALPPRRPIGFAREGAPLETPAPLPDPNVPMPRRQIGFQPPGVAEAPMIDPPAPGPQPRRPAGFGRENAPLETPAPLPDPDVPLPRRQIGFQPPGVAEAPMIEPQAPGPQPRRPAGFGRQDAPLEMPAPLPDPNVPLPRRQIGFQPAGVSEAPMIQPQAPRQPRRIGFGADQRPALNTAPAPSEIGSTRLPDVVAASPRAMLIEPAAPQPGLLGRAEPIRASASGGGSRIAGSMREPAMAPRLPEPAPAAPAKPAPIAGEPAAPGKSSNPGKADTEAAVSKTDKNAKFQQERQQLRKQANQDKSLDPDPDPRKATARTRQEQRAADRARSRNPEPKLQAESSKEAMELYRQARDGDFTHLNDANKRRLVERFERLMENAGWSPQKRNPMKGNFDEWSRTPKGAKAQPEYLAGGPRIPGQGKAGTARPDYVESKPTAQGGQRRIAANLKSDNIDIKTETEALATATRYTNKAVLDVAKLPEGHAIAIRYGTRPRGDFGISPELERAMNAIHFRPGSPITDVYYGTVHYRNPNLP